jgi:hypothetical protein
VLAGAMLLCPLDRMPGRVVAVELRTRKRCGQGQQRDAAAAAHIGNPGVCLQPRGDAVKGGQDRRHQRQPGPGPQRAFHPSGGFWAKVVIAEPRPVRNDSARRSTVFAVAAAPWKAPAANDRLVSSSASSAAAAGG